MNMRHNRFNLALFALCGIAWMVIVVNSTIYAQENPHNGRAPIASDRAITAFARTSLNDIQLRSFAERKEFCGLILEDDGGNLEISLVIEGRESDCDLPWISPMGRYPVATFHTHGAFNASYDSEVPSTLDMQSDMDEQIDGFVTTPGGRLWKIDWQDEVAAQLCGEGCVASDPNYRRDAGDAIARSYTLHQLGQRQN